MCTPVHTEESKMGEIVLKKAPAEDILSDVGHTLTAAATATAAGAGDWSAAESYLRPVYTVAAQVSTDLATAKSARTSASTTRDALDRGADKLIAAMYDRTYNALGRPGNGSDPLFLLLFPHGPSTYSAGPDDEQPQRMGLLVELLASRVHPRLDPLLADAFVAELNAVIPPLAAARDAVNSEGVRVGHLSTLRRALAQSAQVQLSRLKKHWRAEGRSEASIHEIIPDRPRGTRPSSEAGAPVPA
jgi:hypothetical protein